MKNLFTFAICAYKDSPYLEEAVLSAKSQSVPVEILIATSTPSEYIRGIAARHNIPCYENPRKAGIASDWNFALSQVKTPYAAILHQDDIYFPRYAEKVIAALEKAPDSLIAFTDYADLLSDGKYHSNRFYLWVKRFLLWLFYLKNTHHSRIGKRSALIFGNAICCPAVSYNIKNLKKVEFDSDFSVNLDWEKWLSLSETPGSFVFVPKVLMAHRIDASQETGNAISDNRRYNEDLKIFERIWGKKAARFFMLFYKKSYAANQICSKKENAVTDEER